MLKRLSLFAIVGVLAVFTLAACGKDNEGPEATVTRIPDAANAPVVSPTAAATTAASSPAAASPAAGGSPAASPAAAETETTIASPEASAEASPETVPPPSNEVTVQLLDIRFDPTEITIPANTDVTITLENNGAAVHTFDVDALNIHSGPVDPGTSKTVTVNAAAGDYEYYCAEPGHKQAGMVGTLHVVAEGGEAPATEAASRVASPEAEASPAATGQTAEVDLEDIKFDPKELTIAANTDVTVNLVNKGVTAHTFDIDALNIHTGEIAPGASMTVTINAAPGTYEYYCAVPGHKQAGMVGTLTVQ